MGSSAQAQTQPQPGAGPEIDPTTGQPVSPGLNMALRRPSDRQIGGGSEQAASADPDPNQPQNPAPQYPPQNPGQPPGQPQYPGQPVQPDPSQPAQPQIQGNRNIRDSRGSRSIRGSPRSLNTQDNRSIRDSPRSRPIRCLRRRARLQAMAIRFNRGSPIIQINPTIQISRIIPRSRIIRRSRIQARRGRIRQWSTDGRSVGRDRRTAESSYGTDQQLAYDAAAATLELRSSGRRHGPRWCSQHGQGHRNPHRQRSEEIPGVGVHLRHQERQDHWCGPTDAATAEHDAGESRRGARVPTEWSVRRGPRSVAHTGPHSAG